MDDTTCLTTYYFSFCFILCHISCYKFTLYFTCTGTYCPHYTALSFCLDMSVDELAERLRNKTNPEDATHGIDFSYVQWNKSRATLPEIGSTTQNDGF